MPTVLLVEDDDALRYAIERHLSGLGLAVVAVPSSMAALKALEEDATNAIVVLLTDIVMPEGNPHGIALSIMVKRRLPRLQIVYITGYRDVVEAHGRPLDYAIFTKPLDLPALGTEILRLASAPPD